jgi:hypothetical protein
LFGFDEDQNIVLSAPLIVDAGANPIPAGTLVPSQYVFFDPGPTQHVIGTVNFDSDVLGIITGTAHLAASDFLANTGVTYLNPGNRGLEAGDSVTISGELANTSKRICLDLAKTLHAPEFISFSRN